MKKVHEFFQNGIICVFFAKPGLNFKNRIYKISLEGYDQIKNNPNSPVITGLILGTGFITKIHSQYYERVEKIEDVPLIDLLEIT